MITPTQIGSDCILYEGRAEEVLPLIRTESVDLTVTSPPYDNLRTYGGHSWDFEIIARELYRVTKQGGVCVWVVGDQTIDGSETLTSAKQKIFFREGCGWNIHDTMIYVKINPLPNNGKRLVQAFEYIFVLSKGAPMTFNPPMISCQEYHLEWNQTKSFRYKRNGKKQSKPNKKNQERKGWNVFEYVVGRRGNDELPHPAVFPNRLAEDQIELWSITGDTVLDCFAGSGTTGKAAKLRGRKSILIEVDSSSISLIKERLSNIQPLFDQSVPAIISTNCT